MGQTEIIEDLFDEIWVITEYDILGYVVAVNNNDKGLHTVFKRDGSLESKSNGIILKSNWTLNSDGTILTLKSDETNEKSEMKIIHLDPEKFIFFTVNPEGMEMTITMRKK